MTEESEPCPECGDTFKSNRGLKIHGTTVHGIEIDVEATTPDSHKQAVEEWHEDHENPAKRQEVRDKIAETKLGDKNPMKDPEVARKSAENTDYEETGKKVSKARKEMNISPSEETKKKISESLKGREFSEEHRQKLSEAWDSRDKSGWTGRYVFELGHFVRSSWETDFAFMLRHFDIEYEYEPEYELVSEKYFPDFETENYIVEVKGVPDERSVRKGRKFMQKNPEKEYVVIGQKGSIPCDIHIEWEERRNFAEMEGFSP